MRRSTLQNMRHAIWMVGVCLLCACAPQQPQLQPPLHASPQAIDRIAPTSVLADEYYRHAEAQGKRILHIDSTQSLIVQEVRRAGPFARLGHDHVVASHDVSGFVAPDAFRADLSVPLDKLVVDEKDLREEAGFDTQPTPDDIAGTRHNMLTKVLESQRFPLALIHIVERSNAERDMPMLDVTITLHGVSRTFSVPAIVQRTSDRMVVTGRMQFRQSDFGIVPFSILNGAIRVQDELTLRFRIVADKR